MEKTFHNIGYNEINEFLSDRKKFSDDSDILISINYDENKPAKYGKVDPVFFSYLLLLYTNYPNLKIKIKFNEITEDAFFGFAQQVKYIKHLYKKIVNNENFIVEGNYLNKSTGEIITLYESSLPLQDSKSFVPPIFIDFTNKENSGIKYFFDRPISEIKNNLLKLFYEKLIIEIKDITKSKFDYNFLINESFVNIVILRILTHKETGIFKIRNKKNINENINILKNIIEFSNNLTKGLKELALNFEHSSEKKGVISIRRFNYKQLTDLKSSDEIKYLQQYKNEINSFLDISVIDLGSKDIKESYIENLKDTKEIFINALKENNEENEIEELVKKSIGIQFDDDIKQLENESYEFHNIFLSNKNSINNLSIQKNKLISKIGLQFFTKLIKDKYDGYIKISSLTNKTILYNTDKLEYTSITDNDSFIRFGTYYNSIIPIKNWNFKTETKSYNDIPLGEKTNTFYKINSFNTAHFQYNSTNNLELINYKKDKQNIVFCTPNFINQTKSKYENFIKLYTKLSKHKESINLKNDIIAISCKKIEDSFIDNPSHWIRFIWTLSDFFENIILYDINLKHFKSIVNLRKLFNNVNKNPIAFWDDNSRVLFYSYKNSKNKDYYRYGANLLAGNNIKQFNYINTKIWTHHYSHLNGVFEKETELSIQKELLNTHFNSVFFNGNSENLHYFEVILKTQSKNENEITLFEKSVQYSLNTELREKISYNTNNKGYKISDTHFRLGSKIHISDFYYAKKLFHNSFFTTPLSYLISEQIWHIIKDKGVQNYSLIGYENYSSFLISSIRNFLEKKINKNEILKNIKINHSTIDKDGNLSREKHRLYNNAIIIVPIATTFSTSLKIEEQLNNIIKLNPNLYDFEEINIIEPTYNIILVAHKENELSFMEGYINKDGEITQDSSNIYHSYNWKKINKIDKEIIVERYNKLNSEISERKQKYLIPVYTTWHKAENCNLCFPTNNHLDEKCLVETGPASITPQLIFGYPKTKQTNRINNHRYKGLSLEGSLLFGNLKNNKNRYLYFNRTGRIVSDNESEIIAWIKSLKTLFGLNNNTKNSVDSFYKENFVNKKIVLIVPNTNSRSKFLDLINEYLFDYTANSIIISINEDYIENSETLYADGLHNAETVIYIDDVLATVKSFNEVNKIIKYIRKKKENQKGIDFCISLINRMSYSDEDDLLLQLKPTNEEKIDNKRLIYYHKINNPTIEEANKEFPIELERKKYDYLENISSLDQIRYYFHLKKNKLKTIDLKQNPTSQIKDYSFDLNRKGKRNKKLFQLLVLDAIYKIFECKDGCDFADKLENIERFFPINTESFKRSEEKKSLLENAINKLINEIVNKLKKDHKHYHIIEENLNNIEFVIFKVICSTPLIYYKEIRETALFWNIIKLENTINRIKSCIKSNKIAEIYKIQKNKQYTLFQDLRFLLKNSIKLKSNIILSKVFLDTFKDIIEKLNILEKNENYFQEQKEKNELFAKQLSSISENTEYLNNPFIKVKLYDFIQNSFKDGIIDKFIFDGISINKENNKYNYYKNDSVLKQKEITSYHKKLIKNFNKYKNEIIDKESDLFITEIQLVKTEDKDTYEKFNKEFNELISNFARYKLPKESPSKSFIYQTVAIVQELLYKFETKSIKLDKIIDEKREVIDDNANGSFQHFLRLLRLENIEIINKYASEIINSLNDINDLYNYEFINNNRTNKKIQTLLQIQKINDYNNVENSVNSFLQLKSYLNELNSRNQNQKAENIEVIISKFSQKLKEIINNKEDDIVEDIIFSVYYKNDNYTNYTFFLDKTFGNNKNNKNYYNSVKMNESLSSMMGNSKFVIDKYHFSNFEIIKDKQGNLNSRQINDQLNIKIINNPQFEMLNNDSSILLIRITKINNEIKNNDIFKTLSVITIYLKKGKRINEKRLRLLLALRLKLSKFFQLTIQGTTFLELLRSEKKEKYISSTRHYFGNFYHHLSEIAHKISKQTENEVLLECHTLILDAIKHQQLKSSEIEIKEEYSIQQIIKHIKLILNCNYLGNENINENNYEIILNGKKEKKINIPKIIYKSILLQLLINIKNYSYIEQNRNIIISITDNNKSLNFVLKNHINTNALTKRDTELIKSGGIKEGLFLIKEQIERINKFNKIIIFEHTKIDYKTINYNSIYTSKLEIKY